MFLENEGSSSEVCTIDTTWEMDIGRFRFYARERKRESVCVRLLFFKHAGRISLEHKEGKSTRKVSFLYFLRLPSAVLTSIAIGAKIV